MRPEDFKSPFKWAERAVLFQDNILFVPDCLKSYEPLNFSWSEKFGNEHAINVEYCSGNGAWIVEKALAHPELNWIAVEKKFERVRKIWSKSKNLQLKNLLMICGEAQNISSHYFTDQSFTEIYINFPDPWPKKRHWKHRIVNPLFLKEIYRTLADCGRLTLVTDDLEYSRVMIDEVLKTENFNSSFASPHYVTQLEGYGCSYFEELWRSKGKEIRYHRFYRNG